MSGAVRRQVAREVRIVREEATGQFGAIRHIHGGGNRGGRRGAAHHTLDGYVVKPEFTGQAVRMNQIAVFIGLLFWMWVWGVAGMILAVPVMVVIKSVCDRIPGLHPVGELLGE